MSLVRSVDPSPIANTLNLTTHTHTHTLDKLWIGKLCKWVCAFEWVSVCVRAFEWVNVCVCVRESVWEWEWESVCVCEFMCVCVCVCVCVCEWVSEWVCEWVCVCVCVLVEELLSGVWYDDVAEAVAGAELWPQSTNKLLILYSTHL